MSLNACTLNLEPYPMEELARIRLGLEQKGVPVFDFGTGDPLIPTWDPIRKAAVDSFPKISQYPTVKGTPTLQKSIWGYLERRFGLKDSGDFAILPTAGSKEAIFHIHLCLVGRAGGKTGIIYPDPGYPVYRSGTQFAGGVPVPVRLTKENKYLLEPWKLPLEVQKNAAAIWINYPHNPTGATATEPYFRDVIAWAKKFDVIVLSDDCYVDIYDCNIDKSHVAGGQDLRPLCPITMDTERTFSFMSLSKRSGITGYRSGFMIGPKQMMAGLAKARANFGVSTTAMIAASAVVAWNDDAHVVERRRIFSQRIKSAAPILQELGMLEEVPSTTFYLWCKIPKAWGQDDVKFCLGLAEKGVITSPSSWLSEGIKGYVRFALVPEENETLQALAILREFVKHAQP